MNIFNFHFNLRIKEDFRKEIMRCSNILLKLKIFKLQSHLKYLRLKTFIFHLELIDDRKNYIKKQIFGNLI